MTNLIGQSLGRYHIVEQLGEGGMAVVYKAFDTRLERDVAIKIIRRGAFPPDQLDQILKRFEREAKSLGRLSHPNIVKVYDYGEYKGAPYLVLEYLPSGTLKSKLQDLASRTMPWQEAIRILLPIARALQFAHDHGIIHRDIKPSNILITLSGEPMLSDFGIAKILDNSDLSTLTSSGAAIGTPEYMAPEQWSGIVSPRSDMYSLGVVLYEMVTGRKPYTADTPAAILLKQATEPLPLPSKWNASLPQELEVALLKALEAKPEDRYSTMGEIVAELEKLLKGQSEKTSLAAAPARKDASQSREGSSTPVEKVSEPLPPTALAPDSTPQPPLKTTRKRKLQLWIIGLGVLVVVICLAAVVAIFGKDIKAALGITHTPTGTWTPTNTSMPEYTPTPSLPTFTPTFQIITRIRPQDGMVMVQVPEGEFNMGLGTDQNLAICLQYRTNCSPDLFMDEAPAHAVILDAYWLDQTEVTNGMYAQCVKAGICQVPNSPTSVTRKSYFNNSEYADYPVLSVDWYDARTYCKWAGARLPTEAEWEKAARGTNAFLFPWGNNDPTCILANYWPVDGGRSCVGDTSRVGSYPAGQSPYGAYDLAGNVAEWVNDGYDPNYYNSSPYLNPQGPDSSDFRVLRGGAWNFGENDITTVSRVKYNPISTFDPVGFRCASSTP
jgi:eukaryotic-like serine/threonine-protein kinase